MEKRDASGVGEEIEALRSRVRELERAADERNRLRALVDALPDVTFIFDAEGHYLDVITSEDKLLYKAPADIIGSSLTDLLPTDVAEPAMRLLHETIATGNPHNLEYQLEVPAGTKWFEARFARMHKPPAGTTTVACVVRDITTRITDQKALAERLQRVQKLESLAVLAGGIAHDFNNLLTTVLGYISLFRLRRQTGPDSATYLEEAERACLRAQGLTHQLLTFAKGGEPRQEPVDLKRLLPETARFAASGSRCRVEIDMGIGLWPAYVDLTQIHQVINNLVLNAVQGMPQGGTVFVKAENAVLRSGGHERLQPGRYVKLSIQDEGAGIAPVDVPKVFDPYLATSPQGHGLSLALAYSIVEHHKGTVDVVSEVGNGTRVEVYLPAAELDVSALPPTSLPEPVAGTVRILVMDDDPVVLSVTTVMLQTLGYQTKSATSCFEATTELQRMREAGEPVAAAILDLTIPGEANAVTCLGRLRAIDPDLVAIVTSGYSTDSVVSDFAKHGFAGALTKPFSIKSLANSLSGILGPVAKSTQYSHRS